MQTLKGEHRGIKFEAGWAQEDDGLYVGVVVYDKAWLGGSIFAADEEDLEGGTIEEYVRQIAEEVCEESAIDCKGEEDADEAGSA